MRYQCSVVGFLTLAFVNAAFGIQTAITDSCGGSLVGTHSGVTVDQLGNVAISGMASDYVALFGCDPAPPATPVCSLSASSTQVAPGSAVTLFAKCSSGAASYSWNSPPNSPGSPSGNRFTASFGSAGSYTFSVSASNAAGQGPLSNQLTILVGGTQTAPLCSLTASPPSLLLAGVSKLGFPT